MKRSRPFLLLLTTALIAPAMAMQLTLVPTNATCTYASGSIEVTLSGGVAPYTFVWADGPTTQDRTGLLPGTYSLTVTDALSDQVTQQVDILSEPYNLTTYQPYGYCGSGGQLFPAELTLPAGSNGPWTIGGVPLELAPGSADMYAYYPGTQYYTLSLLDGNGCNGTITGELGPQVTSWPSLTITDVQPSCTNQSIGTIDVLASGPAPSLGVFEAMLILNDTNGFIVPNAANVDPYTHVAHFVNVAPGNYGVHWWMGVTLENLDPGICGYDTLDVVVPNLQDACGSVTINSWYDVDADCVHEVEEVGIPSSPFELQPGGDVVFTNSVGALHLPLFNGSYTLQQLDPYLTATCPPAQPIPFTIDGDDVVFDVANGSTQPLDLRTSVSAGLARPGFQTNVYASVRNLSSQLSGAVTFTVTLDPTVVYLSATPTPTSVAGNTITWEFAALGSYQYRVVSVLAQVPLGTPLGTPLLYTATGTNTLPDIDPTNDTDTYSLFVTGSFDPNEKTVRTSSGSSDTQYLLGTDNWLTYTIRFQNTGTDTAFTVIVTDTLPAMLDMSTFEQGATSHPFETTFRTGHVVEWRFPHILLADSNTNEAASHGQVTFRIRPVEPLLPGTLISNNADIFFDFNTAVRTNDAVLVAEASTSIPDAQSGPCRAVLSGGHVVISATGDPVHANALRLFGTDGRLLNSTGRVTIDRNGTSMNVETLPAGCYLLVVSAVDGRTWSHRFVK